MSPIASFVFFDIETTGLPWQEKNQTKIIEFSFVAALKNDILTTSLGNTPPVSKLTFVLNPQMQIHPEVTNMTGLSNDLLQHAPIFRQKVNSVVSFLEDLPKPVCLVAHNGNTFDYKILLAECKDAGASLSNDLLCVDSLLGFRTILKGTNINFSSLEAKENTSSTVENLLTDDEDEWPDFNVSTEEWEEIDEICLSLSDMSCEDINEAEEKGRKKNKKIQKAKSKAIKNVFNKQPKVSLPKECFKLTELYKRLLNKEESNAHRAEVDCLMLVQCVVALKHDFLPWADNACKKLTDIKPLIRY